MTQQDRDRSDTKLAAINDNRPSAEEVTGLFDPQVRYEVHPASL